ncbi:MAG: flagellar motor switch protein FliN [Alphaproteobacteria bacterium]|nr:flagellar motor switch protein FliN [Alphaproteobacteria bacterium]
MNDDNENISDSSKATNLADSLNEMEPSQSAEEHLEEFSEGEPMAKDVTAIYDIPVQVSAVLGHATMQVSQLLKLGRGAVVELDRKVGEAVDIYVNNRLVARGEVVVVEDKLGVTMTEIVKSDRGGDF